MEITQLVRRFGHDEASQVLLQTSVDNLRLSVGLREVGGEVLQCRSLEVEKSF